MNSQSINSSAPNHSRKFDHLWVIKALLVYSAVVVGAGPAGSTAARFLLEMGHEVLLIDQKGVVGIPKQCAEGLFRACFPEFSMASGDFLAGNAHHLEVVFPNGTSYRVRDDICMLDRPSFDQHLLNLAESAGAELLLGEKVVGVDPLAGEVSLACGKSVHGKIIIGADGPASRVARSMGLRNQLIPAAQVEMTWSRDSTIYAYLDKDVSPYSCWIFPKNETGTANVGCFGTVSVLQKFISKYQIQGNILKKNGGAIPVGVQAKLQEGNALLIGDAGGLTNPFTGGGLYPAARSARMAAQSIDEFLKGTNNRLNYESRIRKDFISNGVHLRARNLLANLSNEELNQLGLAMNGLVFPGVKFTSSPWLIGRVLRHPGILKMKYLPLLEVILMYCLAGKVW